MNKLLNKQNIKRSQRFILYRGTRILPKNFDRFLN